jgi:glucosamine--fructose-6-phosphate aminotransferase (isomerizing)
LAEAAEHVLDLGAGRERAVAATKTYTSELMVIALLSAALAEDRARMEALEQVPDWMEQVLAHDGLIEGLVERYRTMVRCVVLGRGFNYATAYEWALKLKELTYVVAEPYSSADFMHGPIAMVERGFPVLAVSPRGAVHRDMGQLLDNLSEEKQADLVVVSDDKRALGLAQGPIPLPPGVPEWISPMICIVPAQLFSYHLARAKGYNPDEPRGLSKVTQTR